MHTAFYLSKTYYGHSTFHGKIYTATFCIFLPYHEHPEDDALRAVHQHGERVLAVVGVRHHGRVVEHGGEQVDGGHGDEEQEGRLHQRALVDRPAVEDGGAQRHEDGRARAVHHGLVEEQPLAPPVTGKFPAITDYGRSQRDAGRGGRLRREKNAFFFGAASANVFKPFSHSSQWKNGRKTLYYIWPRAAL